MNPIDYFDRGHSFHPQAPCLIDAQDGSCLSYAQARDQSFRIASTLLAKGYGIGQKAAVWSGNYAVTVTTVLGLARAGLIWVPINQRNSLIDNIATLTEMECEILFLHADHAGDATALCTALPRLREIVILHDDAVTPRTDDPATALSAWLTAPTDWSIQLAHDSERLFSLVPSSGTSGKPKGIMTPARTIETMTANLLASYPYHDRPRFLAVSPLSHASGGFMHYIFAGSGALILLRQANPDALAQAIHRHQPSHTFLAPTVLYDVLAAQDAGGLTALAEKQGLGSLSCVFYGGAPAAPSKIAEAIRRFGPIFTQIYGQVEVGGSATALSQADHLENGAIAPEQRLRSAGRALPFVRVEIMADDDSGTLLPPDQIGEVVLRGQGVMLGYYKDDAASRAISAHGWHHTQDIGYKDAQGYLYIVDRKRDLIISGGFNIYSVEVENAALHHPDVVDCAAIGLPDARWGEAVRLIVVARSGAALTADALIAFCRDRIGSVKAPKSVRFVDALPKNAAGKVLKARLRAEACEDISKTSKT